ncbi:hypothetical protein [Enterococcus sp. DIV0187]
MKITEKEKKTIKKLVESLEKSDFLVPKMLEIKVNRFTVEIFKKILEEG